MGRPREFDFDDTLERAMQAFWAKGYEATSLDDLCASTGLGRSSLYAAFGDKQSLYLNALARYETAAIARITTTLSNSKSPLDGIMAFIDRIIDDIVAGPGRRGCFIGNCAAELARQDRTVAAHVRQSLERVQSIFRDALVQARDAGQLSKNADVDALAAFLMSGIQGLRLVGKANPDRVALKNIGKVMLRCLE
ncbi:MAG: TetR family transcriptional regulator C-terminal domain-containing protein [Burkholderiales bacterium]